jgi:N6-adenosine-specific RNA methylase IME4
LSWEGLNPPYRTIVADPPWPMPETGKRSAKPDANDWWTRFAGQTVRLPYSTSTVGKIAEFPVAELADRDAHLYLWVTNRFLEDAFDVARSWGFRPGAVLTWCKPAIGLGFGGAFVSTTEFVLTARRGSLANTARAESTWWNWPRVYVDGHIAHSVKPPAFLDLVERVSPGPYVELFARQPRLGWDSWGWGYEKLARSS